MCLFKNIQLQPLFITFIHKNFNIILLVIVFSKQKHYNKIDVVILDLGIK